MTTFVIYRSPPTQADLEINKEGLLADLVCLLDVDLPPHVTATLKSEIEKFFIDGGTRIDLIAQVMELDNNIGTYNYDIANLKETQKQIQAVNKAKGKNSVLKNLRSGSRRSFVFRRYARKGSSIRKKIMISVWQSSLLP